VVLFNYSTKELTAKVVYYGPGLCGKTTNLQWIHEKLPIKNKGKMLSLATETDRTLFFDFLPIEIGTIRGMKTRIQLYTVPGQVFYNATRRMVLKGADAVVFVCDSQEPTFEGNLESFENLRQNLIANEIDPDDAPVVLQYNKRDLPNALPIEILNERLNKNGYPWFEAVAVRGIGVEDTLKAVTKLVFKSLSARYGDAAVLPGRSASRPAAAPPVPALPVPVSSPPPVAVSPPPAPVVSAPPPPVVAPPRRTPPPVEPQLSRLPEIEEDEPGPDDSGNPFGSLPPLDLDLGDDEFDSPAAPVRASGARPIQPKPEVPTRPPLPPEPPPPALQRSDRTLVTSRDEADDLRRRIATPGLSDEEEDLGLEELEPEPEGDEMPRLALGSAPPLPPPAASSPSTSPVSKITPEQLQRGQPSPPPPEPSVDRASSPFGTPRPVFETPQRAFERPVPPEPDQPALRTTPSPVSPALSAADEMVVEESYDIDDTETEVEVPIDVEIAPGTSRLTLRLKLTLNLKQR
jgi:mutual gliding-motility protein MglA